MSPIEKAATKLVNELLERADGSRTVALDMWKADLRHYNETLSPHTLANIRRTLVPAVERYFRDIGAT